MKKYLVSLLAVAIAIVGCKPKQQEVTEVTSLTLDKTSLTLKVGDAPQKITATTEPADATVTWETSDEAVATVQGGLVTAKAAGKCEITAKAGEKSAKCEVTVLAEGDEPVEPDFVIAGFQTWNLGDPVEGLEPVDVTASIGTVKCNVHEATIFMWGDGVVFDGNSLSGAGYVFICPGYTYVIAEGDYAGYYIAEWSEQVSKDSINPGYIKPGSVTENYAPSVVALYNLDYETATDDEIVAAQEKYYNSIEGSYAFYWDITGEQQYLPDMLLSDGIVAEAEDGSIYFDVTLDWFDYSETAQMGVKGEIVEVEGDSVFQFTEPYEVQFETQRYKNYDFNVAEALKHARIINPSEVNRVAPVINSKNIKVKSFRQKR